MSTIINNPVKEKIMKQPPVVVAATDDLTSIAAVTRQAATPHDSQIGRHYKSSAPIGLFDSGVGGLSVYLHLAQQLPAERYIYYADTLHVPYGNRDSQDIQNLTLTAIDWLYRQGCKLIVIACNSASAYALDAARLAYPYLPIVGLVPALKPAVLASQSKHVAVLATKATLEGALLNQVIIDIATPNGTQVTKYFDPKLVPWVEAGMPATSATAQQLRQQLADFADKGVDSLVLGCTHYPFFKDFLLQEIKGQQLSLQVLDSGQAIAARVQYLLVVNKSLALSDSPTIIKPLTFYASKYNDKLKPLLQRLLGQKIEIKFACLPYYASLGAKK